MCGSGRQLGAALTATRGQDGATGAGPHAGTEAVRAAAAPIARLERALAHGTLPGALCRRTPSGARERPLTSATRLLYLSLIHISEPTRLGMISYAVFCLKK